MNKLTLSALAATTLFAMPALAQNAQPAPPANQPGASSAMTEQQVANLWRASKLDGVDIYNNNNEKIGEIDDVLMDKSGKAMAVVVDVGGFLGIGTHRVALKFEDVKFSDAPRSTTTSANTGAATTTTSADRTAPAGAPPTNVSTTDRDRTASTSKRMYPDHAVINMTKDQLKALPQISYSR